MGELKRSIISQLQSIGYNYAEAYDMFFLYYNKRRLGDLIDYLDAKERVG